jgi:hypothetical protein
VVRVPLDRGVEEADGGALGAQEFIGVVQVLPGLFDRPPGVVVELWFWWPATMCRGPSASTVPIASRQDPNPPASTLSPRYRWAPL